MKTTQLWSAMVLGAALALSGAAQAQSEGQVQGEVDTNTRSGVAKRESVTLGGAASGFGQPGQLVLTNDFGGDIGLAIDPTYLSIALSPAVDYFLQQNLSVGALATFGVLVGDDVDDRLNLGLAARIGYALPIKDSVSLWPRLSLGFNRVPLLGTTETDTQFALGLDAPVLLHLAPHFFLGAGPYIDIGLSGGQSFTLGARITVGGYF